MKPHEASLALGALGVVLAGTVIYQHLELVSVRGERDHLTTQREQLTKQRDQLTAQRDQLSSDQNPRYVAAKRDCAATAERMFHEQGYNDKTTTNKAGLPHNEEYSSHYSRRLGRCLYETATEDMTYSGGKARDMIIKSIFDADERRDFGSYVWASSDTKKYWEQKPMQCHLTPPDKPESYCATTDEWTDYERELMNS